MGNKGNLNREEMMRHTCSDQKSGDLDLGSVVELWEVESSLAILACR